MLEIEIKLPFINPADAEKISSLELLKNLAHEIQHLHTIYFDTPDTILKKHGFALRIRKHGAQYVQTVKAAAMNRDADSIQKRQEWEVILTENRPQLDKIPSLEAQKQLQQLIGNTPLTPIFETIFARDLWTYPINSHQSIEIALDRGKIVCQNRSLPICELELELKNGDDEQSLKAFAQQFIQLFPFSKDTSSKAKRGYQLAAEDTL